MQAVNTAPIRVGVAPTIPMLQFPDAYVGQPYSVQVTVSGGFAPFTWGATGLPPGLTMNANGLITGTPTAAGTGTATVTATDVNG